MKDISIPTIILPTGKALQGLHKHSGDTFREMVELWASRKYCNIERRDDTPYVWWGHIGEVLLYDRPTMLWLRSNQPSYKAALYGNTFKEFPTYRDRKWSFWGRSPKKLELAAQNMSKTYTERTIKSIFLGRIENKIQKANRTKHDWSKVIELFSMPIDSVVGPYKYSQEEYLKELANARYGLCLPGYGPKCNREIEYFALGTVPIVTHGVDMVNYQSPPIKDIHYFVVNTPEEVKHIVENTSKEKWQSMSIACQQWWKTYASAEGIFRLTLDIIINESLGL